MCLGPADALPNGGMAMKQQANEHGRVGVGKVVALQAAHGDDDRVWGSTKPMDLQVC